MSLKTSIKQMRQEIRSAYKSEDTEEFFDRIFTKPLGFIFAKLFIYFNWTPNMVTILSMFIGAAGGVLFYFESFRLRLIGVLLLIFANILDSTDGQIARLTNQKSQIGRILDALSTTVWYFAIYPALCLRLMNQPIPFCGGKVWGVYIWILMAVSALWGHQRQCMLADYFRNIHLFFLKNRNGSELDRSSELFRESRGTLWKEWFKKIYLFCYGVYTRNQEKATPHMQRLLGAIEKRKWKVDQQTRDDFLQQSRKHIQLTNILTFNTRAYTLFACVLLNVPVLYFLIDLFGLGTLLLIMKDRYEKIAENVLQTHKLPGYEIPPRKKNYWNMVFFGLGVIGTVIMLTQTDLTMISWGDDVFLKVYQWLPEILLLWLAIYLLYTFAYRVMIGKDACGLTLRYLLKVTISGFAVNHVTPVGVAGGEPYRIMELKPYIGTERATAVTLNNTVMFVTSHVVLWFTGAFLYLINGTPGGKIVSLGALVVFTLCGLILYAFLTSGKHGLVMPTLKLLSRLPFVGKHIQEFVERKQENLNSIDQHMAEFRKHPLRFWSAMLLMILARMLEAGEYFIIFRVLDIGMPYSDCIIAIAMASLIGNLVFIVPMQMGARESGMALALRWLGVSTGLGITASLLSRIRELIYLVIGVSIMTLEGDKGRKIQEWTRVRTGKENAVLILSGGSGVRFGSSLPKQYHKIRGKTVIGYVLEAALSSRKVDIVMVAGHPCKELTELQSQYGFETAPGGEKRNETLANGLNLLHEMGYKRVVILDAVRPMVTTDLIDTYLRALEDGYDAVSTVQPITDSLGCKDMHVVDRERYYLMQSPEAYDLELLHAHFDPDSTLTEVAHQLPETSKVLLYTEFPQNPKLTYPWEKAYIAQALKYKDRGF